MPSAQPYPIPTRLNLLLSGGVVAAALGLLWWASQLGWPGRLAVGLLYAHLLLTAYALLHEATHGILHPDPRLNSLLGTLLGWLFPISFTLITTTHAVHHRCNRTDYEMFDCYYPGDSRWLKRVQWYGLLLGIWWWLIPLGNLLLAFTPRLLQSAPFRRARSTRVLFDDFGPQAVKRLRLETLLGLLAWWGVGQLLALDAGAVLLCYALFGYNWSTRQYLTHAFTPREVRDGALNLALSRPEQWLLLNGHWDRVHHQHPRCPWIHLPQQAGGEGYDTGYWRHYGRLWRGPRPCTQPGPEPLSAAAYQDLA